MGAGRAAIGGAGRGEHLPRQPLRAGSGERLRRGGGPARLALAAGRRHLRRAEIAQAGRRAVGPVLYQHVLLWSRDGRTLALTFFAEISIEPRIFSYDGVALLDVATGRERVLLNREGGRGFGQIVLEWTWRRALQLCCGTSRAGWAALQPGGCARLHLGWRRGLVPDAAAAGDARLATAPIGNPNGDAVVTQWQPGIVSLVTPAASGTGRPVGVSTWSATFAAWSPDGRYLIDGVTTGGRLEWRAGPHRAPRRWMRPDQPFPGAGAARCGNDTSAGSVGSRDRSGADALAGVAARWQGAGGFARWR